VCTDNGKATIRAAQIGSFISLSVAFIGGAAGIFATLWTDIEHIKFWARFFGIATAGALYFLAILFSIYAFTGTDVCVEFIKRGIEKGKKLYTWLRKHRVAGEAWLCIILAFGPPVAFLLFYTKDMTPKKYALVIGNDDYTPEYGPLPLLTPCRCNERAGKTWLEGYTHSQCQIFRHGY